MTSYASLSDIWNQNKMKSPLPFSFLLGGIVWYSHLMSRYNTLSLDKILMPWFTCIWNNLSLKEEGFLNQCFNFAVLEQLWEWHQQVPVLHGYVVRVQEELWFYARCLISGSQLFWVPRTLFYARLPEFMKWHLIDSKQ